MLTEEEEEEKREAAQRRQTVGRIREENKIRINPQRLEQRETGGD